MPCSNLTDLRFADFDGNFGLMCSPETAETGEFHGMAAQPGNLWASSWSPRKGSSFTMDELAFADLNGDGTDDFISRQSP